MKETAPTGLHGHLAWLKIPDCACPHEWRSYGRLYGISMGKGWIRMVTDSTCPHHGRANR